MKWNNKFFRKLKLLAALMLVFLLVLATNMMDNHHFEVVKKTLKTVYEDRLVAKNYIFRMSAQLKHKELAIMTGDEEHIPEVLTTANDSLQILMDLYSGTKLTSREAGLLRDVRDKLATLEKVENQWEAMDDSLRNDVTKQYQEIESLLAKLSEIQLTEGKRQIEYSNRAIANSDLISKIEIGVLIAIGLIVQILIIYKVNG
ncbi:MCP four helix bundle domain-containing protein [Fulvivirga sedimenti]|uniref:MCP four helix bundle domain-containing protein n=1 Tax=Fulvivirga sedimenti TaxID=2879465 RepID=A0A9X1KXX4_9BACT|nr:MCP four helix bundle domain-containing protein [Fulvivirga sedimenti]MCA6074642.1 MCP four helix bundle domain-containing protein [Fulvivirga sedimenti]MCA6075819.1 MCP four helix bundle domain-containing protein [Fulvivirga sedimenti]MCA6076947.1 MCP four helix bundle domain-containing protein [Fulvivirga sedimenti]